MTTSTATSAPSQSDRRLAGPDWTREDVLALSQAWKDPEWFRRLRLEAWEQASQLPMPTPRDEAWRKTNLGMIHWHGLRPYTLSGARALMGEEELPAAVRTLVAAGEQGLAGFCVQHHEAELFRFLQPELADQGVVLMSLRQAMDATPDLLREHLFQLVPPNSDRFAALHGALVNGGVLLYVPPGVQIEAPILTVHWHSQAGGHTSPHTLAVLGEGSSATLVEAFQSPDLDDQALATGVSEVFVGPGARCRYLTLQEWGDRVMELAARRVRLERDASVQWLTLNVGARLARHDLGSILAGEGASAEMHGLGFASERQHLDQHTLQEHQAGHARSDLLFKVALRKRGRAVYRGVIRIHRDAQRSDAYQANRNLLLSPHAKVDTMPILEIEANDVRCTHGASLGRVDAEQMFYLASRGLSPLQAERILVDAFFAEMIDRVQVPLLRERAQHWIGRKLEA